MTECPKLRYQSPIVLSNCNTLEIKQSIDIKGRNKGAIYNIEEKIFEVSDEIILTVGNKRYQLQEYHFHIPGEHKIKGNIYPSEVHYVFEEITEDNKNKKKRHYNICGGKIPEDVNLLVIGRVICPSKKPKELSKLQVRIPKCYFEYDGGLTTGDLSTPVLWIVGKHSLRFNINQLTSIAKTSRPLQPLDGRIILTSYV